MKFLVGWLLLINKIKIKCKGEKNEKENKGVYLRRVRRTRKR